jgi:hypothetical protein
MVWRRNPEAGSLGWYDAEVSGPDGTIKLTCHDGLGLAEQKWVWKVEWPTGEVARGTAATLVHGKYLCEWAAISYEPFEGGFRKKEGYV